MDTPETPDGIIKGEDGQSTHEQAPDIVNKYKPEPLILALPTDNDISLYNQTPDTSQKDIEKIEALSDKYNHAEKVLIVAGSFGLGDSVMDIRYAVAMANKTGREIVCQVPKPLVPVVQTLSDICPNIKFVEQFEIDEFFDLSNFVIKFQSGELLLGDHEMWLNKGNLTREEVQEKLKLLDEENNIFYWHHAIRPQRSSEHPNFYKKAQFDKTTPMHDFENALMLKVLGVNISEEDIENNPIISISETELEQIPQDIDVFLIPDAKEFETPDRSRSKKSLDLKIWDRYFEKLSKNQDSRVAIALGTSHPDYCEEVIKIARDHGIEVEVVSGDLLLLAKQMLRAKKIIGMDSGTSHEALDVIRFSRKFNREIKFLSLFYDQTDFFKAYGIVGAETFLTHEFMDEDQENALLECMLS